jgi:tRNA threonylcarbamoyladenosine biosynthesis protein TsaB
MPLILNIETSTTICSVCLAKDETVIDFREERTGNSHAKILTVYIDELFKSNNLPLSALDAVTVSSGPGSYTGLRIGTSVAKGLCYALNKPLIAVPTLLALAIGIQQKQNNSSAYYMPVLDARRMDAYTALYDSDLNEVRQTNCITLNEEFENSINGLGNIYVGGNATEKCRQTFSSPNFIYTEQIECDARTMIRISNKKYLRNEFENTAYFEPVYLKEFPLKSSI